MVARVMARAASEYSQITLVHRLCTQCLLPGQRGLLLGVACFTLGFFTCQAGKAEFMALARNVSLLFFMLA